MDTINIKNNFSKKILLSVLSVLLILSAGFLVFSSSGKSASADGYHNLHTEFYYAESAYSEENSQGWNLGFGTDINNSSAVLSKKYYIKIAKKTYERALEGGKYYFVVAWGRKAEMDILARYCSQGSLLGDPNFYWDSDTDVNEVGNAIHTGLIDAQYNEGIHDKVYHLYESYALPEHATFPYVGYRVLGRMFEYGSHDYLPVDVTWSQGNLFDIGILVVLQKYDSFWPEDDILVSYYTDSTIVSTVKNRVQHAFEYSRSEVGAYEKALGIYSGGADNITEVTCSYLEMVPGHFNKYRTVTDSFNVYSVYVPDENCIRDVMLSRHGGGLSGFDLKYVSEAPALNADGTVADGSYVETLGSRIIRQARGFTSSYTGGNTPEAVAINITYDDYLYKDFFIKLSNSGDPTNPEIEGYFENNLEVCIYPTSVDDTTETGFIHLYFDCQKIFDMFGDTLNWTIVADKLVLYLDKVGWDNQIELPAGGYSDSYCTIRQITGSDGNNLLDVRVASEHQDALFGIEISGTVPIGENVEFDCYIEYKDLSNDLVLSDYKTIYAGKWWSHRLGDLTSIAMSRNTTLPINLYNAVSPGILNGIEYVKPVDIVSRVETVDWENHTRTFRVRYEYVTGVVLVTDNIDSIKKVYSLPSSESYYTLKTLGVKEDIPSGYRVKSFESSGFVITRENKANALNTEFSLPLTYDKSEPRSIVLELTDKWPVTINYLEQWKASPFAVMKDKTVEVRVADYPGNEDGDFSLFSEEVANLLGNNVVLQFLQVAVKIDQVNIKYDEDNEKYIVDLVYTHLSILTREYSTTADEIKVALTPFSVWRDFYGKDWSIMFLNNSEHRYFDYSNDVAPDKLYGFFSYVVFKDEIHDFSNWLREKTSGGVSVLFSKSEVKGSGFYKFLNDTTGMFAAVGGTVGLLFGHPIAGAAIGTVAHYSLASISEAINDENGTYYTYFFFLDGTTDQPWITDTGAQSRDDDDSALENRAQDAGNAVGDFFSSLWEKIKNSTVVKVIAIVGAAILGIIVLSLVIKLLIIIFRRRS